MSDRQPAARRGTDTIEDRWARELAQRKAVNLDRAEPQKKPEATGGGNEFSGIPEGTAAGMRKPAAPDQQPSPAEGRPAQPKRSFWQKLFERTPAPVEREREPDRDDFKGTEVAGTSPEASPRASHKAEKLPEALKPAEEERRPSAHLFIRIFGALIEAYQNALDRHTLERAQIEEEKRRAWRDHANDVKTAAPQKSRDSAPMPTPAEMPAKTGNQDRRETRAEALRRLRQQEERADEERERRLEL